MESSGLNLLPREEVSLSEKTLQWALTSGRVIVVVTEFIVISAFLYRFILDRTLTDLNTSIDDNIIILEESRETERAIRLVQTQLTEADRILRQYRPHHRLIETLARLRPAGIVFDQVNSTGEKVTIFASTNRSASVIEFYQNLLSNPALANIRIEEVGAVTGKIKFQISAQIDWAKIVNEDV